MTYHHSKVLILLALSGLQKCPAVKIGFDHQLCLEVFNDTSTEVHANTSHQLNVSVAHGYNSSLALRKTPDKDDYLEEDMEPYLLPRIDTDLLKSLIDALRAAYNDAKDPLIQTKTDVGLLEDMLEEFEELDLDHDGFISQEEFRRSSKFTAKKLEEMIEADCDGDNEMDFTEFAKSKARREADDFSSSKIDRDRLELLMKEFKTHDRDNDGSLSESEYRQVRFGVDGGTDDDSNINDIIEEVGEGDFDFMDVVQLMQASL